MSEMAPESVPEDSRWDEGTSPYDGDDAPLTQDPEVEE